MKRKQDGLSSEPKKSTHQTLKMIMDVKSKDLVDSKPITSVSYTLKDAPKVVNIRVANLRKQGYANLEEWTKKPQNVYIGRHNHRVGAKMSLWYNPFSINAERTREDVLNLYRKYLRSDKFLLKIVHKRIEERRGLVIPPGEGLEAVLGQELATLTGKQGCWCAPEGCHGDVLMEMWKEMFIKNY